MENKFSKTTMNFNINLKDRNYIKVFENINQLDSPSLAIDKSTILRNIHLSHPNVLNEYNHAKDNKRIFVSKTQSKKA